MFFMTQKLKIIFITTFMGLIGILHYACPLLIPDWPELHFVIIKFFFIPIILGAYWWGLWGGGILALVSATFYAPDLMRHWGSGHFNPYEKVAEIILFLSVGGLLGALSDSERRTKKEKLISDQRAQAEFLKAITDPLTQVFNRRFMDIQLQQSLENAAKGEGAFSFLMLDIDGFKAINDRYSHGVGDQVLKAAARILTRNCRSTDFVFRYGGDEFIILLTGSSKEEALRVAEKMRKEMGQTPFFDLKQNPFSVNFSIGVLQYQPEVRDLGEMLSRLDATLFQAKKEAGHIFSPCALDKTGALSEQEL